MLTAMTDQAAPAAGTPRRPILPGPRRFLHPTAPAAPHAGSRVVWTVAVLAALLRFPGLIWPLRPDEAGFGLVADAWDPGDGELYGPYWVDRSPILIAAVRAAHLLGGDYALRLVAALGCVVLVVMSAMVAREIAALVQLEPHPRRERRAAVWAAVTAGALVVNPMIDVIGAKGELLGLPVMMTGCWAAFRAVHLRQVGWAVVAGVMTALSMGLKQSQVSPAAFLGVLLLGVLLTRQRTWREVLRLGFGMLGGMALVIGAVCVWAVASGAGLDALWYAVVGFRGEATEVLAATPSTAQETRAGELFGIAVLTGMVPVLLFFLAQLLPVLRVAPVIALSVCTVIALDLVGVVLGGSYWTPYLFTPVVGLSLAMALLGATTDPGRGRRLTGLLLVSSLVVSSVVSLVVWTSDWVRGMVPYQVRVGSAIGAASEPGDTLVVYGGRADIQWASGLPSPYRHLWSLPMRTADPDLAELQGLMNGPQAPTWVVTVASLTAWDGFGQPLVAPLSSRYVPVGDGCGKWQLYRLASVDRPTPTPDCTSPQRGLLPRP